jgi:RimJ/RimL family protein N-acetyltransferase
VTAMTVATVPRLETPRLVLRAFAADDFEAYAAIMSDPAVTRFLGDGRPLDRTGAWWQLAMLMGHWALRGFGVWAVEERATGRLLGRIGFMQPEGWPDFELAYTLGRSAWGHGYATEGGRAALEHARATLGRKRIVSVIRPDNVASIAVATRLGAVRERDVQFYGSPAVVYAYV